MNQRLKELALEAGYTPDMFGVGHWDMPECKKFAELIVQECIVQCEEVAVDADKTSKSKFVTDAGRMLHEGMWGGAKSCSGRIKEHFGVSE